MGRRSSVGPKTQRGQLSVFYHDLQFIEALALSSRKLLKKSYNISCVADKFTYEKVGYGIQTCNLSITVPTLLTAGPPAAHNRQ